MMPWKEPTKSKDILAKKTHEETANQGPNKAAVIIELNLIILHLPRGIILLIHQLTIYKTHLLGNKQSYVC
jgi:hypothetical protein